jgi:hypothetical protein
MARNDQIRADNRDWVTTPEVAEMLGVSRDKAAEMIDNGTVPGGIRPNGRHRRVPRNCVLDYIESVRIRPAGGVA